MKKSEKLFMLINKIDENIIAEAKPEAQKANRITIEKRGFPIKETVAAAACFAVLAGGIFAAFRFRLNNADPLDSDVGNSQSSGISLTANAELDDILRALEPGFEIYDWFFDGITGTGEHRFYFGEDDTYGEIYYNMPENYLQSYAELEELVNKYFTEYTAGVFMKYVCQAKNITKRPDGSYTVTVEDKGRAQNNKNPIFIEANGKLFCKLVGRGSSGVPDIGNAKIKTRTDTAISFALGRERDGEELYSDETVKFENGGWRLDYYMPWLDQNDDMELRNILKDLVPAAEDIDRMFYIHSIVDGTPDLEYRYYNSPFYYYLVPEGTRTEPNGLFEIPQSYDGIEELISEHFSKRTLESFKMRMGKGKFNENGELEYIGKYTGETFIEADGKMYRRDEAVEEFTGLNLGIDIDTAKVTRKTDKTIEFSYMGYSYPQHYGGGLDYAKRTGSLSYEDGEWKLDYFLGSGFVSDIPNDYSDEDLELQAILETLRPGDALKLLFAPNSVPAKGDVYNFMLMRYMNADDPYQQYIDVSEPQPEGWQKQPKSLDELEKMLLEYFTEESTAELMSNTCKGKMTDNGDGTYNVTLDKDITFPVYIEIDGKMFYRFAGDPDAFTIEKNYYTEKVVYRSDDIIKYSYSWGNGTDTRTDLIKYERGGWKFAPYDPDPELTYEPNKEILGDLGLTYDQMVEKHGKLKTNTYKGVMFENSRWLYGWKSENGGDFYVDNDHTNPGGLPEAGGCNIIFGVRSHELLTNFRNSFDYKKFCERYGFTLVSSGSEYQGGYCASFTHPQYPGVTFSANDDSDNSITWNTTWWIQLDVDCTEAKPVVN